MYRVGYGYDVHRLAPGRKMVIGGVEIPAEKGILGHSDADVLLHAVCDALLGALALGDIGHHFPDTDAQYKDISSMDLLRRTGHLIKTKRYEVVNLDTVLILERPKIAPYVQQMRENIAGALDLQLSGVSVKATTSEGLGFVGSGDGVVAHATVLVRPIASL